MISVRKNLASVYEWHKENSIIPPLKNRFFYIKFHENFIYRGLLLLQKYERSEFIVAFYLFLLTAY